ncbi:nucleoporin Nup186 [Schizosaccharomyces osmophilus]|uniref:Nucleoporin Nup186 n=1 Tax=Schizosaccharomyces osmophilus TaxID=2545709 RepID=A0AAE9WE87_9SCHI|nr:nucleoporin Nup186 [Schizosaccharomyces osmophilus]WBW74722.1 nucleoporin Nup186 [Schizosaccharomyces osmophilus]
MDVWELQHFSALFYLLQCIESNPSNPNVSSRLLVQCLDSYTKDFQNFLTIDPPNAASRNKLESGEAELNGMVCKLNETFIKQSLTISSKLSMDEIQSACLLQKGVEASQALDRTPIQAALYMFFLSREQLLESLELLTKIASFRDLDSEIAKALRSYLNSLCNAGKDIVKTCCDFVTILDTKITETLRSEANGQVLGIADVVDFQEYIKLSHEAHIAELETVAIILYHLSELGLLQQSHFESLLSTLSKNEPNSKIAVLILPSLLSFLKKLLQVEFLPEGDGKLSVAPPTLQHIHHLLIKTAASSWSCPQFKQILGIWWLTYLNEACKHIVNVPSFIDYALTIKDPASDIIHAGVFSDIITFVILPFRQADDERMEWSFAFKPRSRLSTSWPTIRPLLVNIIFSKFRSFCQSFISYMPEILKVLRLLEEDKYLTNAAHSDSATEDLQYVFFPFEEFYHLLSSIYTYDKSWSLDFWSDIESDMYGFLTWSMESQIPGITTSFTLLLVSICTNEFTATKVHELMSEPAAETSHFDNSAVTGTNWSYIFNVFHYYISQLKPIQTVVTSSGVARVHTEPGEIDINSSFILQGYVLLFATVTRNSSQILVSLCEDQTLNPTGTFFELLECRLIESVRCTILTALESMSHQSSGFLNNALWNYLDNWFITSVLFDIDGGLAPIPFAINSKNVFPKSPSAFGPLLNNIRRLTATPGMRIAFIKFLTSLIRSKNELSVTLTFPENLGSSYRASGVKPYVDFVIETLVLSSTQWRTMHDAESLKITNSCLQFISAVFDDLNLNLLIYFRLFGNRIKDKVQNNSLYVYLTRHPAIYLLEAVFVENVYSGLFDLVEFGFDQIEDVAVPPLLVSTVLQSLFILRDVLALQRELFKNVIPYITELGISKHILDLTISRRAYREVFMTRISSIVHLALLVGSRHQCFVQPAIEILGFLVDSEGFMNKGSTDENKLLCSIVRTANESKRIIFGFIRAFEFRSRMLLSSGSESSFILRFLLNNLKQSKGIFSLALLILGFDISSTNAVIVRDEPGYVGSQISLLNSLLNFIELRTQDDVVLETPLVMVEALEIVAHLCSSPLTYEATLAVLRDRPHFLVNLVNVEPIISQSSIQNLESLSTEEVNVFSRCLHARAQVMTMLLTEIHFTSSLGKKKQSKEYVTSLIGSADRLRTSQLSQKSSGFKILDFMDILRIDNRKIASELPKVPGFNLSMFVTKFDNGVNDFQFDTDRVVKMYKLLFDTEASTMEGTNEEKEVWYNQKREKLQDLSNRLDLFNARVVFLQHVHDCLESWARLTGVLIEDCHSSIPEVYFDEFIWELLRLLLPGASNYSLENQNTVSVTTAVIETIVPYALKKMNALKSEEYGKLTYFVEGVHGIIVSLIKGIQCQSSDESIRENLYGSLLSILTTFQKCTSTLSREDGDPEFLKTLDKCMNSSLLSSSFLDVLTKDALYTSGSCWELSVITLNFLHRLSPDISTHLYKYYLRRNFIGSFVDAFSKIFSDILASGKEIIEVISGLEAGQCFLITLAQNKIAVHSVLTMDYIRLVVQLLLQLCKQGGIQHLRPQVQRLMLQLLQIFILALMKVPLKVMSNKDKALLQSVFSLSRKLQDSVQINAEQAWSTEAVTVKKYVEVISQLLDLHRE